MKLKFEYGKRALPLITEFEGTMKEFEKLADKYYPKRLKKKGKIK